MNITVVIVERAGTLKESLIKQFSAADLYKKCNFKNGAGFEERAVWPVGAADEIVLYGKTDGRAQYENKYEFPPPAATTLFFGSCLLVKRRRGGGAPVSLTAAEWKATVEQLFGGFEDLATESEPSSESESSSEMDDFIVEDEEPRAAAPVSRKRSVAAAPAPPALVDIYDDAEELKEEEYLV